MTLSQQVSSMNFVVIKVTVFHEQPPNFREEATIFCEEVGIFREEAGIFSEEAGIFSEEAGIFSEEPPNFREEPPHGRSPYILPFEDRTFVEWLIKYLLLGVTLFCFK